MSHQFDNVGSEGLEVTPSDDLKHPRSRPWFDEETVATLLLLAVAVLMVLDVLEVWA